MMACSSDKCLLSTYCVLESRGWTFSVNKTKSCPPPHEIYVLGGKASNKQTSTEYNVRRKIKLEKGLTSARGDKAGRCSR